MNKNSFSDCPNLDNAFCDKFEDKPVCACTNDDECITYENECYMRMNTDMAKFKSVNQGSCAIKELDCNSTEPVCVNEDGNDVFINHFNNECELKRTDYVSSDSYTCPEIPLINNKGCTKDLNPVCSAFINRLDEQNMSFFKKTFDNRCIAESHGATLSKEGACYKNNFTTDEIVNHFNNLSSKCRSNVPMCGYLSNDLLYPGYVFGKEFKSECDAEKSDLSYYDTNCIDTLNRDNRLCSADVREVCGVVQTGPQHFLEKTFTNECEAGSYNTLLHKTGVCNTSNLSFNPQDIMNRKPDCREGYTYDETIQACVVEPSSPPSLLPSLPSLPPTKIPDKPSPTNCDEDYIYDQMTNSCVKPPPAVHCNKGYVFNKSSKTCVDAPSPTICPPNTELNSNRNLCLEKPAPEECESGFRYSFVDNKCKSSPCTDPNMIWNESTLMCMPPMPPICDVEHKYDIETNKCIPLLKPVHCPKDYLYDEQTNTCVSKFPQCDDPSHRYDKNTKTCIPSSCDSTQVWNESSFSCVLKPSPMHCEEGYIFDMEKNSCTLPHPTHYGYSQSSYPELSYVNRINASKKECQRICNKVDNCIGFQHDNDNKCLILQKQSNDNHRLEVFTKI